MSARVLVTGHDGYIGVVMVPMLQQAGFDVVGLDSFLFHDCTLGKQVAEVPAIHKDIRDVTPDDLEGFDAVVHLAAISNDPLGDLNPRITFDINHLGTELLAKAAKQAGVTRFAYSSSCSLYGAQGDEAIDESGEFFPVTPYGTTKMLSEESLRKLADDDFSPTYLRNATAYGASPRLRGDLVVNNLTGFALTTGEVFMKSDGTPWRPLVHIEDISRAFVAVLQADRSVIHDEAFNVGATTENYQIRDVAAIVEDVVTGSRIKLADSAGPDLRNYRVNCDKLAETLPDAVPVWTVRKGVEQLVEAFTRNNLTLDELEGPTFMRIRTVRDLLDTGRLTSELRWQGLGWQEQADV